MSKTVRKEHRIPNESVEQRKLLERVGCGEHSERIDHNSFQLWRIHTEQVGIVLWLHSYRLIIRDVLCLLLLQKTV